MKTIVRGISLVILFGLACITAYTQTSPETVVANLYQAAKLKGVADMSKAQLRKYFDDELADQIWKAAHGENGLDFDLIYNAQDTQIKNFQIGKYSQGGRFWGWVSVSFSNFGERQKINFKLSNATGGAGWKIVDIHYKDGSTLMSILKS
jgi:hypothetical protein